MSIIFIRLDKIGDLVASLPVDQHPGLKDKNIEWVIAEGLGWIAKQALPSRNYMELSLKPEIWKSSYKKLTQYLQSKKPEAVIVFYAPWWVSLACWTSGVPLRGGRLSQWHSFLFFNRGFRQSRSQATQHEADYNRELVEKVLDLEKQPTAILQLQTDNNPRLLEKWDLQSNQYIVVHPGMFGSALNWPQLRYIELIESLIQTHTVAITGTKNDARFLSEILPRWQNHSKVRILIDKLTMPELLSILKMSKAVVAPSTGVLHLAAALGKNTVGIYSPILVHHPKRWGPRGALAKVILPPVSCPALNKCLLDQCSQHPCMSKITAIDVLKKLELGTP